MTPESFDPNGPAAHGAGIYGLPHRPEDARVVLIPVPWDATTSYRAGTSRGPEAIIAASKQVDLFDRGLGRPYEHGIAILEEQETLRLWNREASNVATSIARVNELGADLNAWVRAESTRWCEQGKIVGVVGGDHSSPFGAIDALAKRHPGLGILHIDAHADLREAYEGFTWSHASIMHNVVDRLPQVSRLVQIGIRDFCEAEWDRIRNSDGRIITHFQEDIASRLAMGETWASECDRIALELPAEVYISFDIDGLDPSLCPNTGTPVPGGLSFYQAIGLFEALVRHGRKIVGFDLSEVAPGQGHDEWDANVGARILYKMAGWALRSQTPWAAIRP